MLKDNSYHIIDYRLIVLLICVCNVLFCPASVSDGFISLSVLQPFVKTHFLFSPLTSSFVSCTCCPSNKQYLSSVERKLVETKKWRFLALLVSATESDCDPLVHHFHVVTTGWKYDVKHWLPSGANFLGLFCDNIALTG